VKTKEKVIHEHVWGKYYFCICFPLVPSGLYAKHGRESLCWGEKVRIRRNHGKSYMELESCLL